MGRREGRREEERESEGASGRERERVRYRGIKRMGNDREIRGRRKEFAGPGQFRVREERPLGGGRGSQGKALCVEVF